MAAAHATQALNSAYEQVGPARYRQEGVWHDQISQMDQLNKAGVGRPMPVGLISRYAKLAVRSAIVSQQDDGRWLATIREFPGVWAREDSAVEALAVLEEVVFDWALLKVEDSDRDLPTLGDIDLNAV
jgi:predicted RNase H-like HicB family nuclease